ncbi:GNAT family N-acetyltransferase [Actinokineospora sp.]|uniref:GNAT family N-acetyltransferase n=1 Tax=Actinokineospora sp. TaxID=1872133 RepID=UPI004037E82F
MSRTWLGTRRGRTRVVPIRTSRCAMGAAVQVITTYLEQHAVDDVRPGRVLDCVAVERAEVVTAEFSRFLYASVGGDWFWTDRLSWTRDQWVEYLARPMVETWVAYQRGTPAGYVELAGVSTEDRTEVEIAYFGLLPGFLGQGLGGHLLGVGLTRAWDMADRWPGTPAVRRVWVHTCTLDGPAALANYQARGMVAYRTDTAEQAMRTETPGSWPGPR